MQDLSFMELELAPELQQAIDEMGFDMATSIQSQVIPLIRTGVDVIGRSQTGTGKTVAFALPAIEKIDTDEKKPTLQILILCPTRELAQQACEEIKKLTKFKSGIYPVEVYGGTPMARQIACLKRANIVVGTPGRIMDHMRRRTIKLDQLKMVVLDEADEMLSMGFKEDIETILQDTPEDRQTILFSATMPSSILALTKQFQKKPLLIEINKAQMTLENIEQSVVEVPMGRKMDVLNLLLRYYHPTLSIIFCNTKRMVDEITTYLTQNGFDAEGLHGDMAQAQRTKVMDGFKMGKTSILVATDVAARGIDVNNVDYVINYDIPQNTEYYIHRIGRTGRAGKSGKTITICSGKKQVFVMKDIARASKSKVETINIPSIDSIRKATTEARINAIAACIGEDVQLRYEMIVEKLMDMGHAPQDIAASMLQLHYGKEEPQLAEIKAESKRTDKPVSGNFQKIQLDIGRSNRVAPNHIVGGLTERTDLCGRDIGKIDIYDDKTIVAIPSAKAKKIVEQMSGCKICGRPVKTTIFFDKPGKPLVNSKAAIPTIGKSRKDKPYDKTARPRRKFSGNEK